MFRLSYFSRGAKSLFAARRQVNNHGGSSASPRPAPATEPFLDELRAAFAHRRSPAFDRKDLDAWGKAINRACSNGDLDIAEHALRHLRQAFPQLPFARRMCEVFDRLPPLDGSQTQFVDDLQKDVQIAARPGADVVILLFCGGAHKLDLPLSMIHRWLGSLPASLIYLRDFRRKRFLEGIPSLGVDLRTTHGQLRRLVDSLGGRRLVCFGNSGGVFPALYYGHALNANAILGVAGKTNLTDEFNAYAPSKHYNADFARQHSHIVLDARRLYQDTPRTSRICMIYGEDHWNDRQHAEHMGALQGVTLRPIANFAGHGATIELIRRDEFRHVLDWLIAADRFPSSESTDPAIISSRSAGTTKSAERRSARS